MSPVHHFTGLQTLKGVQGKACKCDVGAWHCLSQAAGLEHAAGTLFALPLLDFPAGFVRVGLEWELASGRKADDHHLHPAQPLVSCLFLGRTLQLVRRPRECWASTHVCDRANRANIARIAMAA
jgi:hypothetical protein